MNDNVILIDVSAVDLTKVEAQEIILQAVREVAYWEGRAEGWAEGACALAGAAVLIYFLMKWGIALHHLLAGRF